MFKQKLLILILSLIFLGCSSIVHKKEVTLSSSKKYAISAFWNYTETPMAGLRASSIVESVLAKNQLIIYSLIGGSDEMGATISKNDFLQKEKAKAKSMGAEYLITGNVQEWRYKTGIDGEPVVSYTLKVINLKDDTTLFNGVGAKSGWGHKSIGVVAQEIAEELIPQFTP